MFQGQVVGWLDVGRGDEARGSHRYRGASLAASVLVHYFVNNWVYNACPSWLDQESRPIKNQVEPGAITGFLLEFIPAKAGAGMTK